MIIIELLLNGKISLDDKCWEFNINVDKELLINAYEDLKLWIIKLLKLRKIDIDFPVLNIVNDYHSINIDIDIYKRYNDDFNKNPNTIYCRTDYFDDKNYFKLESDDSINYNLANSLEEKQILEWFLYNIFGWKAFKPGQLGIISRMLNLRTTIGVLPTGSGKSLCYQFSALLQPSSTIIVCPLVSLIKDQYDSMRAMQITNIQKIDSTNTGEEKEQILKQLSNGKSIFTWISPERFQTKTFRECLEKLKSKANVTYFVIDEVHCLSEWGHDFRIAYLQLTRLAKKYLNNSILIGLTATLSANVLNNIRDEFGIERNDYNSIVTSSNFSRDELVFTIKNVDEGKKNNLLNTLLKKIDNTPNLIESHSGGIVFTPFKKGFRGCISLSNGYKSLLKHNEIAYYSSADNNENQQINKKTQEEFKNNNINLLFATKSFGMGIDKPNIRYTIHYGMSSSIDSLYQEVGRAGRDGNRSNCIIIHAIENNVGTKISEKIKNKKEFNLEKDIKDVKWGTGDISDQLLLFSNDFSNYKSESDYVYNFCKILNPKNNTIIISFDYFIKCTGTDKGISNKKYFCESILYRLFLLGIVKDWTVNYINQEFEIEYEIINNEEVKKHLINYIKRSDFDFDIDNLDEEYKEIIKDSKSIIDSYIKLVCYWYYDKITYKKILDICSLDKVLNEYNTDSKFKYFLKQYYTLDDEYIYLNSLNEGELDYFRALGIFYAQKIHFQSFVDTKMLEKISIMLDRFISENKYNEIYPFLQNLIYIFINKNIDESLSYIESILNNIKEKETIKVLANLINLCDKNSKEKFVNLLITKFNNIESLIDIYSYYPQEKILNTILKGELIKITKIEKEYF